MNVISIGYGRHLFDENNIERKRMELCAKAAGSFDMVIFSYKTDGLKKVNTNTGLSIHPTNARNRIDMIFKAFIVARNIIKNKTGEVIVTTQDPFEAGLIGLLLKKIYGAHLTVQEHADAYSSMYWRNESLLNRVRYLIGKYVLRRADTVRVVSERISDTLSNLYVSPMKITKLPVAINLSPFLDIDAEITPIEIFSPGTFVFLSVARFVPQKNFPLMIKAFSTVYRRIPKIRLLIVGTGPEEGTIRKLIGKNFPDLHDNNCPIQILPWTDNVAKLMFSSDAYILSSNYEGWARVLIEALSCNLPIITTDVGCANEVVKNQIHGFVVPVNDLDALSTAMEQLVLNRDMYVTIKKNIDSTEKSRLPGADISNYGSEWVRSLRTCLMELS